MKVAELNVSISGAPDGQPIVFAHGFGCDQHMWRYVAPAFEDRFRVVLFDYVGCGGSDSSAWDAERYASLAGYADDVLGLVHELELQDVVLVGHSVSAMIGALAVAAEPERFARLVMVGPSPRYVDDPGAGYVGGFGRQDIEELLGSLSSNYLGWSAAMAPAIMGNPDRPELGAELTGSFCRMDPAVAEQWARATFLSDNRADLAKVSTPTLVLQSRQDVIAPMAVGEYVHDALPDSELVVLDAVGHCPHLSAPEPTVRAIDAFLGTPA
ncbi:alpha/beta hydrolase [Nocardioides panacisoli]|uniref:Alpha/beta hydrolase n=1 Tax=Nocardioides panacisoli TaxID=627624 RepID=A0ABP7IUZ8_9ACTN